MIHNNVDLVTIKRILLKIHKQLNIPITDTHTLLVCFLRKIQHCSYGDILGRALVDTIQCTYKLDIDTAQLYKATYNVIHTYYQKTPYTEFFKFLIENQAFDLFISECKQQHTPIEKMILYPPSNIIGQAFFWDRTSHGFLFWSKLSYQWAQKYQTSGYFGGREHTTQQVKQHLIQINSPKHYGTK